MLSRRSWTGARAQLADIVDDFDSEYGVSTPMPDLTVVDVPYPQIDTEGYAVVMNERWAQRLDEEWRQDAVRRSLDSFYEEGLREVVREQEEALLERYSHLDPAARVRAVRFRQIKDEEGNGSSAEYDSSNGAVLVDYSLMPGIDPRNGGAQDPDDARADDIRKAAIHEAGHGLQYAMNPHFDTLSDHVSAATEDHDAYTADVRRASIEALTTFEEHRDDPGSKDFIYRSMLSDPWDVPNLFRDHVRKHPDDRHLFNDPYDLGHFAAHAIDVALQEEHGEERGRNLAREYLVSCVTTPEGLEGAVERSFDVRDLPYYQRIVDDAYTWLVTEDNMDDAVSDAIQTIDTGLAGASTRDEHIQQFYEGKALVQAYHHLVDREQWAEETREFDRLLDRVWRAQTAIDR